MSDQTTTAKLISAFLRLADAKGIDRVTVTEVLEDARVSKGSLYYHFATFDDLVAAALSQKYSEGVDRSIAMMSDIVARCDAKEQFRSEIRWLVEQTSGLETAAFRLSRAKIIGKCATNARLRQHVGEEQARLSRTLEDFLAQAQARAWVRQDLDLKAASLLIQAYTFGKVIDDIAIEPIEPAAWVNLITQLFESLFLKQD